MNRVKILAMINQYSFELIVLLAEVVAMGMVVLTLLALFAPLPSSARADDRPGRRGSIRVTAAVPPETPAPVRPGRLAPAEIYITMTALPAPGLTAGPDPIDPAGPPSDGFNSAAPGLHSPLRGRPVAGPVSQGFGCSAYYTGLADPGCPADQPWFHDGVDIAAGSGAPVRAALSGTVVFAGPDGDGPPCGAYRGYGLGVVVDNGGGWQALYAHLSEIEVTMGQAVTADTVIGSVGETGCGTGPHLHFSLRRAGELIDPVLALKP